MKGIDIVVHGSIGHVGALHGPEGRAGGLRRRRRRPRRLDLRGPRLREGRGREPGAGCVEKEMRDEHVTELRELLGWRGRRRSVRVQALRLGAAALQLPGRQRRRLLMGGQGSGSGMTEFDQLSKERGFDQEFEDKWRPGLRESHLFDRNAIHEIHRMAREGIYDIRGFGAKRRVPHFDDLLFLGPASRATRSRVTARSAQPTSHSAPALPRTRSSSRFRSPSTRHELRRAVGAGQGGAWPRSERDGDEHHHRRRRDAARGARAFDEARLPDAPRGTG